MSSGHHIRKSSCEMIHSGQDANERSGCHLRSAFFAPSRFIFVVDDCGLIFGCRFKFAFSSSRPVIQFQSSSASFIMLILLQRRQHQCLYFLCVSSIIAVSRLTNCAQLLYTRPVAPPTCHLSNFCLFVISQWLMQLFFLQHTGWSKK